MSDVNRQQRARTGKRVLLWSLLLLALSILAALGNAVLASSGEPSVVLTLISGVCGLGFVVFLIGGIIRLVAAT